MYIQKTDTEFPKVATGGYPATIEAASEVEGQFGPQIKFDFNLGTIETIDGDMAEVKLAGWTSMKFVGGKRPSKLWQLAKAAGIDCENADGLDPERDLVGRRVRLTVTEEPARDGDGVYNRITAFLPPPARNGAAKPAARGHNAPPTIDQLNAELETAAFEEQPF
jgi:hypothetical protein